MLNLEYLHGVENAELIENDMGPELNFEGWHSQDSLPYDQDNDPNWPLVVEPEDLPDSAPLIEENSAIDGMDASQNVSEAYFKIKPFESEKLYENLGVKFYKKYLPTSGDLVMRKVWRKLDPKASIIPASTEGVSTEDRLREFERYTRKYEAIHLGGFAIYAAVGAAIESGGGLTGNKAKDRAYYIGSQLLINVYPIMVQRYNRIRTVRVINRITQRHKQTA